MAILKKKSGFEDMFFVIVVLFVVIIFLLILAKSWGEIRNPLNEGLTNSMPANSPVNVTTTLDQVGSSTILIGKLMPMLLIGLIGFVLLGASVYMRHPIMMVVAVILISVAILLAVIYANVYHSIASSDSFSSTTSDFAIPDKIMEFLPSIILVIFVGAVSVTLWLKSQGGAGY